MWTNYTPTETGRMLLCSDSKWLSSVQRGNVCVSTDCVLSLLCGAADRAVMGIIVLQRL